MGFAEVAFPCKVSAFSTRRFDELIIGANVGPIGTANEINHDYAAPCSVIDDDESVRESLPHLLKGFGFAVRAFSSAEEYLASDLVPESKCLILDITMPGMSGPIFSRN